MSKRKLPGVKAEKEFFGDVAEEKGKITTLLSLLSENFFVS